MKSEKQQLRVVIFVPRDLAQSTGSLNRARLLARGLAQQGAAVAVIAPGFPEGFERRYDLETLVIGGIVNSKKERLVQIVSFGRQFKPDVVYAITEMNSDLAWDASKQLEIPCVFDLHAIRPIEILEHDRLTKSAIRRLFRSFGEMRAVRRADALTVANPTLLPVVKAFYRRPARLFAGITDTARFRPDGPTESLGAPDRIQVLYAGNFARYQGCDLLLQSAACLLVNDAPYDFTFIGGTASTFEDEWGDLIATNRLRFINRVEYDDMPRYLRGGDILVLPRRWTLSTYLAFPGKISDYMAAGRAILATGIKPHRYAIKDKETGVLCSPCAEAIQDGFLRLRDPQFRAHLGRNARAYAEQHFSIETISRGVLAYLTSLIR